MKIKLLLLSAAVSALLIAGIVMVGCKRENPEEIYTSQLSFNYPDPNAKSWSVILCKPPESSIIFMVDGSTMNGTEFYKKYELIARP